MSRLRPRRGVEAGKLLAWLGGLVNKCDAVSVEILIEDQEPDRSSSVRITLRGVPGPLAGLSIRPTETVEVARRSNFSLEQETRRIR